MAHSILISQSAWEGQFGSVLTHRAWPLAIVPQATPAAFSFYPHGKTRPIAVNIAKLPELPELPLITRDEVPRIALNTIATLPES
jgi:hypothetical protein